SKLHNAVSITVLGEAVNGIQEALAALPNVRGIEVGAEAGDRVQLHVLPEGGAML
ncbi:MAG: hypothetical protein GWO21_16520, partial [Gammaproteobacteria bacterium]|nr:hypothetical protein [Gammaproteobacteria bacterium]